MTPKKLIELAESILKHAKKYGESGDLKDLTKAIVRSRNFQAAALRIDEEKRKK